MEGAKNIDLSGSPACARSVSRNQAPWENSAGSEGLLQAPPGSLDLQFAYDTDPSVQSEVECCLIFRRDVIERVNVGQLASGYGKAWGEGFLTQFRGNPASVAIDGEGGVIKDVLEETALVSKDEDLVGLVRFLSDDFRARVC